MRRKIMLICMVVTLGLWIVACGKSNEDPGTPPAEVLQNNTSKDNSTLEDGTEKQSEEFDGEIIKDAVGVVIGQTGEQLKVDMYNNAAANTMLDYLTKSEMRFPGYTYSDKESYVAQHVRGDYTRDDEILIENVQAGDLYLFSDGQLRLYFRDVQDVNITATPVGNFSDRSNIEKYVTEDYAANRDDSWGVEVYFMITKLID